MIQASDSTHVVSDQSERFIKLWQSYQWLGAWPTEPLSLLKGDSEQFYQWLCYQQSVYLSWKRKQQQSSKISFALTITTTESNFCESGDIIKRVFSLSHSIFILCENGFSSHARNIFIAVVTICSMIDKSPYCHSVSLCEWFIKDWQSQSFMVKAENILFM